jgi:hypothetical protein
MERATRSREETAEGIATEAVASTTASNPSSRSRMYFTTPLLRNSFRRDNFLQKRSLSDLSLRIA